MRLLVIMFLLMSSVCYAEPKIYSDHKFDLGLALSPVFTPQNEYKDTSATFGFEVGYTLFRYEDKALVSPEPTIKLLRFGVGILGNNTPVLLFTPISTMFRNRIYLNPSLGFGRRPHSVISLTYEIL